MDLCIDVPGSYFVFWHVSRFVRDTCQEKMVRIRFLLHIVFRARYVPKKMIRTISRILKIVLRSIFRILEFARIIFFWYVSRTKNDM